MSDLVEPQVRESMRRGGKLTPEQRREIAERYRDGETLSQLAAAYGVARQAIRYWLRRYQVPARAPGWPSQGDGDPRRRHTDAERVAWGARYLADPHATLRSLAEEAGVSHATMRKYVDKAIAARGRHGR